MSDSVDHRHDADSSVEPLLLEGENSAREFQLPAGVAPLPVLPLIPDYQPPPKGMTPLARDVIWLMGEPSRDFWPPLILLCLGILITAARAICGPGDTERVIKLSSLQMMINGGFVIFVYAVLGWFAGIHLGPPAPAALKLAAIAVFPVSIGELLLLGNAWLAFIGGWLIPLLIVYRMFRKLTETEFPEALLPAMLMTGCFIASHYFVWWLWF